MGPKISFQNFTKTIRIILLIAFLGVGIYPSVDIQVSQVFYDKKENYFTGGKNPWIVYTSRYGVYLSPLIFLILIYRGIQTKKKKYFYPALVYLIGAGFLVNAIFKPLWGRARPRDIQELGGKKIFTPYWQYSQECKKNCSFPSGHASSQYALLSVSYLYSSKRLYLLFLLWGSWMGLSRIALGAHFLSDILFAYLLMDTLAYLFFRREKNLSPT